MEGATTMTTAVSELMSLATTVLTTITANSTLMVFFCAGLVFTAISVVKRLK